MLGGAFRGSGRDPGRWAGPPAPGARWAPPRVARQAGRCPTPLCPTTCHLPSGRACPLSSFFSFIRKLWKHVPASLRQEGLKLLMNLMKR